MKERSYFGTAIEGFSLATKVLFGAYKEATRPLSLVKQRREEELLMIKTQILLNSRVGRILG